MGSSCSPKRSFTWEWTAAGGTSVNISLLCSVNNKKAYIADSITLSGTCDESSEDEDTSPPNISMIILLSLAAVIVALQIGVCMDVRSSKSGEEHDPVVTVSKSDVVNVAEADAVKKDSKEWKWFIQMFMVLKDCILLAMQVPLALNCTSQTGLQQVLYW